MAKRPRIDLDGVTLSDPDGPSAAVAIFRYRTVEGLVLSMPESADILVPWDQITRADLSLADGQFVIAFSDAYVATANWLGGLSTLQGRWTDRMKIRRADVDR